MPTDQVPEHVPIQAFSTWEYLADEIEARGWTVEEMAVRMGGDASINLCAIELIRLEDPNIFLGQEMAEGIAKAFGTSADLWLRLDKTCRKSMELHGKPKREPAEPHPAAREGGEA